VNGRNSDNTLIMENAGLGAKHLATRRAGRNLCMDRRRVSEAAQQQSAGLNSYLRGTSESTVNPLTNETHPDKRTRMACCTQKAKQQ